MITNAISWILVERLSTARSPPRPEDQRCHGLRRGTVRARQGRTRLPARHQLGRARAQRLDLIAQDAAQLVTEVQVEDRRQVRVVALDELPREPERERE